MARTARLAAILVGILVTATGCASGHDSASRTDWQHPTTASWLANTPDGHLFTDPQSRYRLTISDDWTALPPSTEYTNAVDPDDGIDENWQVAVPDIGFAPIVNIIADDAAGSDLADYLESSRQMPYGNKFLNIKTVNRTTAATWVTSNSPATDVNQDHAVVATLATDESVFQKYRPKVEPFLLTLRAT